MDFAPFNHCFRNATGYKRAAQTIYLIVLRYFQPQLFLASLTFAYDEPITSNRANIMKKQLPHILPFHRSKIPLVLKFKLSISPNSLMELTAPYERFSPFQSRLRDGDCDRW